MPWYAWIPIAAILVFGLIQAVSILSGRPSSEGAYSGELEDLRRRVKELEDARAAGELEEPRIPTRAEENLAAEDRWRLDMLEARLENLESRGRKGPAEGGPGGED